MDDARVRGPAGIGKSPGWKPCGPGRGDRRALDGGTGDTALYVFAGMLAAVVLSVRVFLVRGAGKAN